MRRRRLYRWLGVGLVVAVGLYFVLDIVSLQYMQSRARAEVARAMSAEGATVKLGSVPFLPGFFSGHISQVSAQINGPTGSGGFGVQEIDFRAGQVRFSPRKMFSLSRSLFSTQTTVTFTDPFGSFEIAEGDLRDYIKHHIPHIGLVEIKPSGIEVSFRLAEPETTFSTASPSGSPSPTTSPEDLLSKPARYLPRIEGRRFVLTLIDVSQVPFEFRDDARRIQTLISLPPIPATMNSDVRLGKGVIVVESQGKTLTVRIGEGPS